MRVKITLAYDGTNYRGWQIQEKPDPPPTIQGAVETALFTLLRTKTRIFGAGRTDSGAHAHGQVAHFDVEERPRLKALDWRKALNAVLPYDIRVISAHLASDTFNARNDALFKTYTYQFWTETTFTPPFLRNYAWACGSLDAQAIRMAIPCLIGKHDFASFKNAGTETKSTEREIFDIALRETTQFAFYPPHSPILLLSVTANGFLKQMVRNIAGFLAAVGAGKADAADAAKILSKKDRRALPNATAPAHGLTLAHVSYESWRFGGGDPYLLKRYH